MTAMKYKLLAKLIEAEQERWGDDVHSWHEVVIDIIGIVSETHGSEEELADAVFDRIALSVVDIEPEEESRENQVDQT